MLVKRFFSICLDCILFLVLLGICMKAGRGEDRWVRSPRLRLTKNVLARIRSGVRRWLRTSEPFVLFCRYCGYVGSVSEFVIVDMYRSDVGTIDVDVYVKCPRCGQEITIARDYFPA